MNTPTPRNLLLAAGWIEGANSLWRSPLTNRVYPLDTALVLQGIKQRRPRPRTFNRFARR